MPISATANHPEKHWVQVQSLIHRTIKNAGLEPSNVWAGEATDRISERIVASIFAHDIVVADISDLNPNVMLELGLRLASKKPTVVISDSTGTIPFDIRDFSILKYPDDLNIVEMEAFMELLSETVKTKFDAYRAGDYSPFLGRIVVDVASPETRSVPLNELVIDRLEQIGSRLSRLEKSYRPIPTQASYGGGDSVISSIGGGRYKAYFSLPITRTDTLVSILNSQFDNVQIIGQDGKYSYVVATCDDAKSHAADTAVELALGSGAVKGVPKSVVR